MTDQAPQNSLPIETRGSILQRRWIVTASLTASILMAALALSAAGLIIRDYQVRVLQPELATSIVQALSADLSPKDLIEIAESNLSSPGTPRQTDDLAGFQHEILVESLSRWLNNPHIRWIQILPDRDADTAPLLMMEGISDTQAIALDSTAQQKDAWSPPATPAWLITETPMNTATGTSMVRVGFHYPLDEELLLRWMQLALATLAAIALVVFGLYYWIRRLQQQPHQDLVEQLQTANENPDQSNYFHTQDADQFELIDALNRFNHQQNQRNEETLSAQRQTESARMRAALLAQERAKINRDLEQQITSRAAAEQKLSHTKVLLDTTLNLMPNAVLALDRGGRILLCNRRAEIWLGLASQKATGHRLQTLIPELADALPDPEEAEISGYREPTQLKQVELNSLTSPVIADLMIFHLEPGQPAATVVRIEDISQRLKMEELMVQSEKMLTVGGLAAGMAHEINNPLGAILQNLQNVRRRLNTQLPVNQKVAHLTGLNLDQLQHYLELREIPQLMDHIREAGERAAGTISNMLNFSRDHMTDLTPNDLNGIVRNSLVLARNELVLKTIRITNDLQDDLPLIPCVSGELQQVLVNLIQNALHALDAFNAPSPEWQPLIEIRSWRDGNHVHLSVSDNGPGVPEHQTPHIFEPFYTTKEVGEGTGLGLSVSYFIVTARHNGTLTYEANKPHGACFHLKLPLEAL